MEHGSLKSWLDRQRPSQQQQVQWLVEVAAGLNHVHSKGFLHRDVAARNVLLDSQLRAKLSDFGLAREINPDSPYYRSRGGQIPVRWTAPEALLYHRYSTASDVWAFAVLAYEIYTNGKTPYTGKSNVQVWTAVEAGERLERPAGCPESVFSLMRQCWEEDVKLRPSSAALHEELGQLTARELSTPMSSAAAADSSYTEQGSQGYQGTYSQRYYHQSSVNIGYGDTLSISRDTNTVSNFSHGYEYCDRQAPKSTHLGFLGRALQSLAPRRIHAAPVPLIVRHQRDGGEISAASVSQGDYVDDQKQDDAEAPLLGGGGSRR